MQSLLKRTVIWPKKYTKYTKKNSPTLMSLMFFKKRIISAFMFLMLLYIPKCLNHGYTIMFYVYLTYPRAVFRMARHTYLNIITTTITNTVKYNRPAKLTLLQIAVALSRGLLRPFFQAEKKMIRSLEQYWPQQYAYT